MVNLPVLLWLSWYELNSYLNDYNQQGTAIAYLEHNIYIKWQKLMLHNNVDVIIYLKSCMKTVNLNHTEEFD